MTDELLNERYALAIERIRQIPAEKSVPQPYRDFFAQMAQYLCKWTRSGAESQKDI